MNLIFFDVDTLEILVDVFDGKVTIEDIEDSIKVSESITILGFTFKTKQEYTLLVYGLASDGTTRKSYIIPKNKITFETNECLNGAFLNGEFRCLIQNGGVFKYFDLNGNEIKYQE